MSHELDEATVVDPRFRRLPSWMSRSFDALADDLRLVDCGSLDVLLYCPDDVVAGGPGSTGLPGPPTDVSELDARRIRGYATTRSRALTTRGSNCVPAA